MEYPPESGGGGIGSYVASIAPALATRGNEVHVLSCIAGQRHRDYLDAKVHIHRRGLINIPELGKAERILKLPGTAWRFQTGISTFFEYRQLGVNFDVIEYPDWGAEGWLFAMMHTKPLVAHLHTPLMLIRRYNKQEINRDVRYSSFLEAFSANRSDLINTTTSLLYNELKEIGWLRDSNVKILSYPIDWQRWENTRPIEETQPTVLFLGRLEYRKAPEVLVKALSLVQEKVPEVNALFVGKSNGLCDGIPYHEWIKNFSGDRKYCQILGPIPRHKLIDIFSRTRVLVMPSRFDSFGLVAAEAMAAGRPVVVSEASGISELVRSNNIGRVVSTEDPLSLAEALCPFLENIKYAAEVGKRAKNVAQSVLDPIRIAAKREILYKKAIENYNEKMVSKTGRFLYAIPKQINNLKISSKWRNWLISEIAVQPWKHFYLQTARQLLEIITKDSIFTNLNDLSGVRVLDVGCTPAVSILLACLGAEVVLLDNDDNELNKGKRYAGILGVQEKLKCVKADAFKIPFKSNTFNLVWNSGFIEHFDEPEKILKQMGRVTKIGNLILVLVPNRWTLHSLWIRNHLRKKNGGYYWDFMGKERSYSENDLVHYLKKLGS